MVGKCIRKKDQYELDYMMRVQKTIPVFYLNSETGLFIGDQKKFEIEFEFKNPLNVSIILFILEFMLFDASIYNQLVKKVNSKNVFTEINIADWLCNKIERVNVLCIENLVTIDSKGKSAPYNRFVCKHSYQGFELEKGYFLLFGEKIPWHGREFQSVNGNIVSTFQEDSHTENFNNHFLLMKSGENGEKVWKDYNSNKTGSRFDL